MILRKWHRNPGTHRDLLGISKTHTNGEFGILLAPILLSCREICYP